MSVADSEKLVRGEAFSAIAAGRHRDPFAVLGLHRHGTTRVVRVFLPQALSVDLINTRGELLAHFEQVHSGGIFVCTLPPRIRRYRLRLKSNSGDLSEVEDSYRFPSTLGALDLYFLGEGSDQQIYKKLGAHRRKLLGVSGVRFAVWAPNASQVSVVGDFNQWDTRHHVMRLHPANGIWEIFIPGVETGAHYKFALRDASGALLPLKSDPYANFHESPPGNASIVYASHYRWHDNDWMQSRKRRANPDSAVSIYEVHLGSWRRKNHGRDYLSYQELADDLVSYVLDMGFTHIEFLPVSEHPFDGSWGYQPIGMFAPTQRFGEPDGFRQVVDRCHQAGISVILDWVPAHFPRDEHGLQQFDGTALYEHEDPRQGSHADWGTLVFNYGRREVVNYLIGSALYWIDEFHIDAIRVDAVASMLYLDYSRQDGQWIANKFGGNENLEAVDFIRRLNDEIRARGASSFAEESTAWPGVSAAVEDGGLGFSYKWNMGWMNDTLSYVGEDPVHRKFHHDKMTFGLVYAFSERFVLPLSHDEVVHGKGSLLARMPGDEWQRLANIRAYLASMFAHPGKKLLFMGSELAQQREWNHDASLDWHLLEDPGHAGIQTLVRDLNQLYRRIAALHEIDFSEQGFEWIESQDSDNSVFSWIRRDAANNSLICLTNFTPIVRHAYRVGVPDDGMYDEVLNTDAERYGGSGIANSPRATEQHACHDRPSSLSVDLPALATVMLQPRP